MSDKSHSTRQVLPLSAAVQGPRFTTADHERSRIVRETLDSFDLPLRPRTERTVDHSESIILDGNVIENRLTTGAHIVRQRRVSDHLPTLPLELAVVEPFEPNTTLQADAATALAAINDRKPFARRTVRPERATAPHWATRTVWVWTLLVGSALTAAAWLYLAVAPFSR